MPTRGSKDPNGRALRGRRAHTTFALLTDPARQIWNSFNNRANAGNADAPEAAVNGCLYDRFKSLYNKTATKPSLVIVPARFKSGTLYSQIPSSNADFTVTRNTEARRFDSAGLVASVASGIPRLDYYTSGGVTGCPALLVEPAATNLALHSRDLTNAVWVKTNVTAVKNAVGADGVASGATTLTATAASGTVLQAIVNISQSRVFSAYVRRVTGTGAVEMTTNGGTNWTAVTISSTYTQVACAAQTVLNGSVGFRMAVSGDVIEVDFTQGEVGPVATSVIPTTAGTGSRSADVISLSSASGLIGQTEGTIYVEGVITNYADAAASFITISDNTINNRLEIRKSSLGSIIFERASATQSASTSINATGQGNGVFKMAVAYKSGDTAFFINGVQVATTNAATFTMNTLTHIYLGSNASGTARWLNDRIRAAALYTTRLSNSELAALTA